MFVFKNNNNKMPRLDFSDALTDQHIAFMPTGSVQETFYTASLRSADDTPADKLNCLVSATTKPRQRGEYNCPSICVLRIVFRDIRHSTLRAN